ncbi:MAG: hypothetical protein K0R71_28 [Bacillales bacterium]|nr:hypothetical protein [Bacillales bacterium]
MDTENLHPSVENFKQFVQRNPKIVQEVRQGRKSWQELYEDWFIFGENHETWRDINDQPMDSGSNSEPAKSENKSDFMNQILGYIKKIDMDQVQSQMNNLSSALSTVQGVISQFSNGNKGSASNTTSSERPHPFAFRKD